MRDLNPSPGVWVWEDSCLLSDQDTTIMFPELGGAVEVGPDDAIVIRYAGELYRRARAVQDMQATLAPHLAVQGYMDCATSMKAATGSRATTVMVECLARLWALFALLDEMRREAGS